ncbi:MAG TPA: glycosyltransferase [Verrucomicrobiae bacterium]|nr:glycosyltransferase [Verrucomicrobiae bacterium]
MGLYVVSTADYKLREAYERSARIALLSEECDAAAIPAAVRSASDFLDAGYLDPHLSGKPPAGSDGMIQWFAGEKLLQGDSAAIRRLLVGAPHRSYLPVHLPYLQELDLISLQPRLAMTSATNERISHNVRIAGNPLASAKLRAAMRSNGDHWARLHLALLVETDTPGSGIRLLSRMSLEKNWHPTMAALVLRNLSVMMMRHNRFEEARSLLQKGRKLHPDCAEFSFILAMIAARSGSLQEVAGHLKNATLNSDPRYVGSGGERAYRASWLSGQAMEPTGHQSSLVHFYRSGLTAQPAFEPSVVGLLRQRLPAHIAYRLRLELCPVARREHRYFEPVFLYMLLHRQLETAARLLRVVPLSAAERDKLTRTYNSVAQVYAPLPPSAAPPAKPGVILTGAFFMMSSLARVNREIAGTLLRDQALHLSLDPHDMAQRPASHFPNGEKLQEAMFRRPTHCDLTFRHHWPPEFRRPPCGKLVQFIPWEYGAVPVRWIRGIEENADELWVPSKFVRRVFLSGGVSPDRIHVIPYGVDDTIYQPMGDRWLPPGARGFVFLFVGGVIERKGLDLLAKAYELAFSGEEDVTLIIKDQGSTTFYQHEKLLGKFQEMAKRHGGPRVVILTDDLSDERLAALYRGCDAFVLPYRGEGFGMPLAEALACGKPVITTGLGPAREFCPAGASYFIRAKEVAMPDPPAHLGTLASEATWFEPSLDHLAETMRYVFEHRDDAARNALAASEAVRRELSWTRITGICRDHLHALLGLTV